MNVSPSLSLWECGNPAPFAGFPSAVETVEKLLLLLDFSTVSTAHHFHNESLGLRSSAVFSPTSAAKDPESLRLKTTRP